MTELICVSTLGHRVRGGGAGGGAGGVAVRPLIIDLAACFFSRSGNKNNKKPLILKHMAKKIINK